MDEHTIHEQYGYIRRLLKGQRLKEAITQLEGLMSRSVNWVLRARLEEVKTSYQYMLEYMKQGAKDPQRWQLHKKIIGDIYTIADLSLVETLDNVSSKQFYQLRRMYGPGKQYEPDLPAIQSELENFSVLLEFGSTEKIPEENVIQYANALKALFIHTWTNTYWKQEDVTNAQRILESELLATADICLMVSAVTLSILECFDLNKTMWLIEAYHDQRVQVSQRALIGLIFSLHCYRDRLTVYPSLINRLKLMGDDTTFATNLTQVYRQILLCQETEKIDKKMREEIIPEMLKNVSILHKINPDSDFDITDNDFNPDWQNAFIESGLEDKLRQINDLQMEGADIYMSTFSSLKKYPFFNEIHNWFYPFSKTHPEVIKASTQITTPMSKVLELILEGGLFSDSDKYSLFFTLCQLPPQQRDMMLGQIQAQQLSEFTESTNLETFKKHNQSPSIVSNQYLHDLYRFYKLYKYKNEFKDMFKENPNIYRIDELNDLFDSKRFLIPIADFFIAKERWDEAVEIYQTISQRSYGEFPEEGAAQFYQKYGYALQRSKLYTSAIQAYLKADMLTQGEGDIWNIRHLATCYRMTRNWQKALPLYQRLEALESENTNNVFHLAVCLVELQRYEEALNYFFKLDYIDNGSLKAWRGIGWCSFITSKYEQALKYYQKIISEQPQAMDYMNMGHVTWVMDDIQHAVNYYQEACNLCKSRQDFIAMFQKDKDCLLQKQIANDDIPLMLDLIQ